ncbi:hypothetical protein F5B22DRAFT_588441 [Xylaria bambusicola]|uniref:uncharacterized protein n=1 Tax=Xylaria bambusicola TaxID=326684 RepID=UPI002008E7BB|nr:uncharacterized protein F5B22DRAFT_588441 [Xylaria bambusicola]KAI0525950.1 hypothetical protein F5B22DRAFT_588441 [Xylaria bambusicola]
MASSINIDAPGAYPATPGNEEPMQQTLSSSRNYTQEIPRNMGDDVHSSGHYLKNSGIYADGPTLNGETTKRDAMTAQPSGRNYTETSRIAGHGPQSSGRHFKNSGMSAEDSTLSGESTKPGVMTGAHSRVEPKDSSFATNSNYTFGNNINNNIINDRNNSKTSEPSARGTGLHQFEAAGALDIPTNIIPPANTPLGDVNNTNSGINTTTNAPEDHNKVQASLRGKSSTNNTEPYWGSIPFGAGVYNGVAGHGSDETATHQHHNGATGYGIAPTTQQRALDDTSNPATTHERSLEDSSSNRPMSTGVYNGVVGHGSNESTSPRTSRFGEDISTDDSSRNQRALPLTSNVDSKTDAKYKDTEENKKDSHYKEALAGAGAAWAGGYAANEYSKRDRTSEPKTTDQKYKEEIPKQKDQTKTYAAVEPRHHKHKQSTPLTTQPDKDQTLQRQQLLATENQDKKADDSKLGYYGAAAAGVGAGAYGMHKYANRDSAGDQPLEQDRGLETQKPLDTFNNSKATNSSREYYGAAAPVAQQSDRSHMREPQQSLSSYNNVNTAGGPARDTYGTAPLNRHSETNPMRETSQPLGTRDSNTNKDDSNLGYYGAAVAAAGAGTYGMHKYANRDREQERAAAPEDKEAFGLPATSHAVRDSSRNEPYAMTSDRRVEDKQPQYNSLSDGTLSGIATKDNDLRQSQMPATSVPSNGSQSKYNTLSDGTYSGIATEPFNDDISRQSEADAPSTQHSQYNKLSDGTDSSIASDAKQTTTLPIRTQKPESATREQQSQYNKLSDGTDSGVTRGEPFASSIANTEGKSRGVVAPISTDIPSSTAHSKVQDTGRSSSDSSHGGQYNVLSSGTPSGINLETNEHARFHRGH